MSPKTIILSGIIIIISSCFISGEVKTISSADLNKLINDCGFDSNYILIDARENSEVNNGIIASEFCKPFHMSWNSNVLQQNYELLPKEIAVYIYCRSGNRSLQAANFLFSHDFKQVYSMTGGITYYSGKLYDSIEFRSWNRLPEPSFIENNCQTAINKTPRIQMAPMPPSKEQLFTLQGRMLLQSANRRKAQIFILERIESHNIQKINGLHRLIVKR